MTRFAPLVRCCRTLSFLYSAGFADWRPLRFGLLQKRASPAAGAFDMDRALRLMAIAALALHKVEAYGRCLWNEKRSFPVPATCFTGWR